MGQKIFQIAVDGPSGAGKSTIAKNVAKKLGIEYIDTGAMYRAVGLKMHRLGIPMEETQPLLTMLADTDIDFSAFASVRRKLVDLQQKMAKSKSVIMDGRDIGTVVLKDAPYKFFLTASDEERARRRYEELKAKGQNLSFEEVLKQLRERDYNDTTREVTPLRKADDAEEIDSTDMDIQEVVDYICGKVQ